MKTKPVFVYKGEALAKYNFGLNHPFGPERHDAFHEQLAALMMGESIKYQSPKSADVDQLALFHTSEYIDKVSVVSKDGQGLIMATHQRFQESSRPLVMLLVLPCPQWIPL